jgi:hypothetical protein
MAESEHERYLTEKYAKKRVIVMNYPRRSKPSKCGSMTTAAPSPRWMYWRPGSARSSGGSQREHRLEVLDRNMAKRGIDKEHYAWYCDLRHYGTVPHAAFASVRAHPRLRHRPSQRLRRHPLPANAGECTVLMQKTCRANRRRCGWRRADSSYAIGISGIPASHRAAI